MQVQKYQGLKVQEAILIKGVECVHCTNPIEVMLVCKDGRAFGTCTDCAKEHVNVVEEDQTTLNDLDPKKGSYVTVFSGNKVIDGLFIGKEGIPDEKQNRYSIMASDGEKWLFMGDTRAAMCMGDNPSKNKTSFLPQAS